MKIFDPRRQRANYENRRVFDTERFATPIRDPRANPVRGGRV